MNDRIPSVLVSDDEEDIRENLTYILEKAGIRVITAANGEQTMQKICFEAPDAVLLDVHMPGLDGMEILRRIKKIDGNLPVVLLTAYANIQQAVESMKEGAFDYIAKPFENQDVARVVLRALAEGRLRKSLKSKENLYRGNFSLIESMGPSNQIASLAADIHRVAQSDFTVVIIGETGTGKELVARAIHDDSARAKGPFMPVDCGAIPENLLESELFGHEKGSFTGADRQTSGKFEMAHNGSLFMDEIGNMPAGSQAKFLRVIQDRKLYRVGGVTPVNFDTRLIVATNLDLKEITASGAFREDLYYRLSEFTIRIPALRERKEDILYLARRFLDMANIELNKMITGFTDEAVETLMSYNWPGNVRQLRSVIRGAALMASKTISEKDLNIDLIQTPGMALSPEVQGTPWKSASLSEIVSQSVQLVEKEVITAVLKVTGGNKARAARLLQVDYKTMHTKVKKLGIQQNGGINGDET